MRRETKLGKKEWFKKSIEGRKTKKLKREVKRIAIR